MKTCILMLVCLAIAIVPSPAIASIWNLNVGGSEMTSSGASALAANAIVMTFDDSFGPNKVRLTIDFKGGAGVGSGAFLSDLVFNANDALSGLTFAYVSGVKTRTAAPPSYAKNSKSLSPKNGFDIKFDFPPPTGQQRLYVGMKSTYDIMATGLNSSSFNFKNTGNQFKAFVHINEANPGKSGKYGDTVNLVVPEPTALTIWLGTMLGGLAFVRLRSVRR